MRFAWSVLALSSVVLALHIDACNWMLSACCLQVKLFAARGLMPLGMADRLSGCQARLIVPDHSSFLSGVVARVREQEAVIWDHEEQCTEVSRAMTNTASNFRKPELACCASRCTTAALPGWMCLAVGMAAGIRACVFALHVLNTHLSACSVFVFLLCAGYCSV